MKYVTMFEFFDFLSNIPYYVACSEYNLHFYSKETRIEIATIEHYEYTHKQFVILEETK